MQAVSASEEGIAAGSSGDVAQLVEHLLCKQGVGGSSPLVSTEQAAGLSPWPADCPPESHLVSPDTSPVSARHTIRRGPRTQCSGVGATSAAQDRFRGLGRRGIREAHHAERVDQPDDAREDRDEEGNLERDRPGFGVDSDDLILDRLRLLGQELLELNKEYVCFRDPDNVQWEFYST